MVGIELHLSLPLEVPRSQMEENLQDIILVLQVVRIDLVARNQLSQHEQTDVQLILNHLTLIEVRGHDCPLDVGHHLIERRSLHLT